MKKIIYIMVIALLIINITLMFIDYHITFILNLAVLCLVIVLVRLPGSRSSSKKEPFE